MQVINGTVASVSSADALKETLLNRINHLDAEDIVNGNAKLADFVVTETNEDGVATTTMSDSAFIEVDTANNTFKIYMLLEGEGIVDGAAFFFHLGAQGSDGYYPNVSLPAIDTNLTITCNGFEFGFTTAADLGLTQDWQKSLLYISVKAV